jgi:hypothetical protein
VETPLLLWLGHYSQWSWCHWRGWGHRSLGLFLCLHQLWFLGFSVLLPFKLPELFSVKACLPCRLPISSFCNLSSLPAKARCLVFSDLSLFSSVCSLLCYPLLFTKSYGESFYSSAIFPCSFKSIVSSLLSNLAFLQGFSWFHGACVGNVGESVFFIFHACTNNADSSSNSMNNAKCLWNGKM